MAQLPDNTLIKQPVASDLRVSQGVMQLTEKYKGRYSHCTSVLNDLYSLSSVTRTTFINSAGTISAAYGAPAAPTGTDWVLAQGTVDECDAGENGLLLLVWNAQSEAYSGQPQSFPVTSTNQLKWQPENYDVYAYCKNPDQHQTDPQFGSQRVAIEQCLHPPTGNNAMTLNKVFQNNDGYIIGLNDHEKQILKWKLEGKKVIKHHPVITEIDTWTSVPKAQLSALTNYASQGLPPVDTVGAPREDFGLDDYTWVCQGTNIQVTQPDLKYQKFSVQKSTDWIGALSVVTEFYGDGQGRWNFGEM